jgi:hypothetical protein
VVLTTGPPRPLTKASWHADTTFQTSSADSGISGVVGGLEWFWDHQIIWTPEMVAAKRRDNSTVGRLTGLLPNGFGRWVRVEPTGTPTQCSSDCRRLSTCVSAELVIADAVMEWPHPRNNQPKPPGCRRGEWSNGTELFSEPLQQVHLEGVPIYRPPQHVALRHLSRCDVRTLIKGIPTLPSRRLWCAAAFAARPLCSSPERWMFSRKRMYDRGPPMCVLSAPPLRSLPRFPRSRRARTEKERRLRLRVHDVDT